MLALTPEEQKDLAALPPALRALLEAELAAGNALVEVGHGFPAAPCGAYFKLAEPLRSRPRESGDGIDFYDRNGTDYAGEITDAKRHFFLLEPPHPPEPEPDMDAIRAALRARQADAQTLEASRTPAAPKPRKTPRAAPGPAAFAAPAADSATARPARADTAVERFRRSMVMDREKWHDGIGYDVEILRSATAAERREIEDLLLARGVDDWRDVEALAALDTPRTRAALLAAQKSGDHRVRTAVADCAPGLVPDDERIASLVRALEDAEFYGGLTQVLLQVEGFHPPPVVAALFRGVLARDGATAVHYAAMLMFVHGKARTSFDWGKRPFFLRFNTADRAERVALLHELCAKLGVDPAPYLDAPAPA